MKKIKTVLAFVLAGFILGNVLNFIWGKGMIFLGLAIGGLCGAIRYVEILREEYNIEEKNRMERESALKEERGRKLIEMAREIENRCVENRKIKGQGLGTVYSAREQFVKIMASLNDIVATQGDLDLIAENLNEKSGELK